MEKKIQHGCIVLKVESLPLYLQLPNKSVQVLLLPSNRELERILYEKQIPAWVDYWGYDVAHDWPWWRIQIRYFMDILLNAHSKILIHFQ